MSVQRHGTGHTEYRRKKRDDQRVRRSNRLQIIGLYVGVIVCEKNQEAKNSQWNYAGEFK